MNAYHPKTLPLGTERDLWYELRSVPKGTADFH
jgi:hypothetical protein